MDLYFNALRVGSTLTLRLRETVAGADGGLPPAAVYLYVFEGVT